MGKSISVWKLASDDRAEPEPVFLDRQLNSLDEANRLLPNGGYTTFRTFGKSKVLRFGNHIQRLAETARLAGTPIKLKRETLAGAIRQVLAKFPADEARVRICLDLEDAVGTLYLLLEPLSTPTERDYQMGVWVVTRHMQRENPKAKLTDFIATAASIRKELPPGINEALMIGADGLVLEGLSSNFFGVKRGLIRTAEEGVLDGITRKLVMEVIREMDLPLHLEGVRAEDLLQLYEAFITSASRGVLPVVEIDGQPLGEGRPGPITQVIMQGYREKIEQALEPI